MENNGARSFVVTTRVYLDTIFLHYFGLAERCFWLSVTVPFIYQDTQNVVLTGGGVASRKEQKGKLAQPASSTTESGLGDVLLKASVVVVEERDLIHEIAPYLKLKFPT